MTDKIEIAKLAAQLTAAVLNNNKNGEGRKFFHYAKTAGADKETPEVLVVFDVVFAHIQSTLKQ